MGGENKGKCEGERPSTEADGRRALKLGGCEHEYGQRRRDFPSRRLRLVSQLPQTPSRRLASFLIHPILPFSFSPTFRNLNRGGQRFCLAFVSSPPPFTDHVFSIFDRPICSGLRRQDRDTSSETFASVNGTASKSFLESPRSKRSFLLRQTV